MTFLPNTPPDRINKHLRRNSQHLNLALLESAFATQQVSKSASGSEIRDSDVLQDVNGFLQRLTQPFPVSGGEIVYA